MMFARDRLDDVAGLQDFRFRINVNLAKDKRRICCGRTRYLLRFTKYQDTGFRLVLFREQEHAEDTD